jgi:PAS domain S-box-containing protein
MMERGSDFPADLDIGGLGKTMLEAAQAAHIGVTVTMLEAGRARNLYISEAAAAILGWPVQELLAGDPMKYVAPEDLPRIAERLGRRLRGEAGQVSYELTAIRGDGSRVPIEMSASPAIIAGRQTIIAFIVDVSARKTAEDARLRNEARFRELIERAPEPIGIVRRGHFVYANPAYVMTLGYPSAQALYAVPLAHLVHPEEAALLRSRERQVVEERGKTPAYTYRAQRYDGSAVLLEVSSVPFDYEGKPSALTMARDVTARKALEAQLIQADRLAALGTMAAGVAHEINNPLAYIMLNIDWIARKLPDAKHDPSSVDALAEVLREARAGVDRVATIVRELRSFSRADGETRRLVDLASVVQSAIRIASHEIRHRARVETSFEPACLVWANEARLEQVVLNLLLNAAQAMRETRADENEIRVSVHPDGGDCAVLEVSDNGEGIPPEVLPRIFDPFFTTKAPGIGTGLGLSICHGIVAALGGRITVRSQPGEGTAFLVVLPAARGDEASATKTTSDVPSAHPGPRARILVIDDELPIGNTMRDLLSAEHDVVAITSGRDALSLLERGDHFDVILCDLMMPGMSGIDFFDRLRRKWPGLEKRVVFMTGGAFTTRAAEFLAVTENRRLEKPFSLKVVERIVREMVGSASEKAQLEPAVMLNIDLGELPGEPEELYSCAHLANVACGGHVGDESTMRRSVELCIAYGTEVGAHPSFADRQGFGRRALTVDPEVLRSQVADQCSRLAAVAGACGVGVRFVKPHGALYHAAAVDAALAQAVVDGARQSLGSTFTIIGPSRGALLASASGAGLGYAREAFADRMAREDGALVPRDQPGAGLVDPSSAAARAREIVQGGAIETICVHGDTPDSLAIARAVRAVLDTLVEA